MNKADCVEYYKVYDIDSKTQYMIEGDGVVDSVTFEQCPYIWSDYIQVKVDRGEVLYVAWKMLRPVEAVA